MSTALFRNVENRINVVRVAVGQAQPPLVSRSDWTQHNYATALTRLYALYEGFVKDLITHWVEVLPSLAGSYSQLDERIRKEYMRGIGRILAGADRGRFSDLAEKQDQIIKALYQNLIENQTEQLFAEAFIYSDSNLRGDELKKLFGKVGIDRVCDWVFGHRQVITAAAQLGTKPENALNDLVEKRNEAAHGYTRQTDGPSVLRAYADLTVAICRALTEKVQAQRLVRFDKPSGRCPSLGRVIEYDDGNRAVTLRLRPSATIAVGDIVLVQHLAQCVCTDATVERLQHEGIPHHEFVGTQNTQVVLSLSARDLSKSHLCDAELFLVSSNR